MSKPKVEDHIIENQMVISALFHAAVHIIDRVILICCLDCGMRAGEVAHMERSWWDGRFINIPAKRPCTCSECNSSKRAELKKGTWTPKTKQAIRSIPVRDQYRSYLTQLFTQHKEFPVSRVRIWQRVKRLQEVAGVRGNIFPHALRGTYITDLLDKGVTEAVVRELVGHVSIATTSKYSRFGKDRLERQLKEKVWT